MYTGGVYTRAALKRMYVNNEQDLNVAKRELQIIVSTFFCIFSDDWYTKILGLLE